VCLPLAFEYAGTNFHKQNSAFLGFYESGSRRLLREDRGRHRIGISENQPHINADEAPQKYNGTEGLLQENARCIVALQLLNYHMLRHRVNANRRILVL
jgi:hypothetical protein